MAIFSIFRNIGKRESYKNVSFLCIRALSHNKNNNNNVLKGRDNNGDNLASYDFHTTVQIPVGLGSLKVLDFHTIWLRHHCPCAKCFNPATFQKMLIPSALPALSEIKEISPSDNNRVKITWRDGHESTFGVNWLQQVSLKRGQILKNQDNHLDYDYNYETPPLLSEDLLQHAVNYEEFMTRNDGISKLLENVVKYGFGIVKNAPPDFNKTKEVVRRISHPQNTIYGDFSEWTSNLEHADTAYTSDFVHLHTDTSYFSEPMGLQMFHCLKHDGDGGINCLVDGFAIAKTFKERWPSEHALLTNTLVPSQYLDGVSGTNKKHHFYSVDTTFGHNRESRRIERVRYNPHDMATLNTIHFDQIPHFYQSLVRLSDEIEGSPVWVKLSPGIIIFLDNWRVLHGRSGFSGSRTLCGAYIGRSDWLSKARVLGLIQ